MRAMFDPLYVYRPWSPARRARARAAARKRMDREARVWNRALEAAEKSVRDSLTDAPHLKSSITKRIRALRKDDGRTTAS